MEPLGAPLGSLGDPLGTPWAPEEPRGQEIYTQTPDQPPEMAALELRLSLLWENYGLGTEAF